MSFLARIQLCPVLALALAAGGCDASRATDSAATGRPNLLLISIDTLRADHLGLYGYERPTSPRLDEFARSAVVFDQAQASASWTLPGLASIFTSHYSSTHGCWSYNSRLDDSFPTLTELLLAAGYDTACVASHVFVTTRHGLQQGMVHFDDSYAHPPVDPEESVTSAILSDKAIRFLEQKSDAPDGSPWFLWVHYFDPHAAYMFHEGISEAFVTPDRKGIQVAVDLYDGEIAYTDRHVGRLLDALGQTGLEDETIVVVLSDHGEEFLEHGGKRHGHSLFTELVRVPLVIRAPGIEPRRVSEIVRTVDVMPTVLELAGLPPRVDIAGASLADMMRGGTGSLPALAEIRLNPSRMMESIVEGRMKLVRHIGDDNPLFLYDIEADPGELTDIAAEHPQVVAQLRDKMESMVRDARRVAERFDVSPDLGLTPGQLEDLKNLGYLGE